MIVVVYGMRHTVSIVLLICVPGALTQPHSEPCLEVKLIVRLYDVRFLKYGVHGFPCAGASSGAHTCSYSDSEVVELARLAVTESDRHPSASFSCQGGILIVEESAKGHEKIRTCLDRLRKLREGH